MPNVLLPLQAGTLPPDICYTSEQARLLGFSENLWAVLPGQAFYSQGPDKPAPEFQAYPWYRTTDGRWYMFSGQWQAPVPYNVNERRLWVGSLASLETFDGGTAGVVTPTSGPMWQEDTDFVGRSPMHPGAILDANPAKTLAVGENFGEGAHEQTIAEMPEHTHTPDPEEADGFLGHAVAGAPATFNVLGGGDTINMAETAPRGGGEAMPVIHPVRGIYLIKWSGRLFWTVP